MYTPTRVLSEITAKFGTDVKGFSGGEVRFNCPECVNRGHTPDTKGHLWVKNSYPILFHCWRCEYSGRLDDEYSYFDYKTNTVKHCEPEPSDSELLDLMEDVLFKPVMNQVHLLEIPKVYPIKGTVAYDYLIERGFSDLLIKYYDLRLGLVGSRYRNRVIVPNVVIKGNDDFDYTDMFVARYIGNPPPDKAESFRKYLNPFGSNKRLSVYNIHRVQSYKPIIITEGCFTAIAAGPQAVATYGKQVSDFQLFKILEKHPSSIYVSLDPDAFKESNQLCERIQKLSSVPVYQVKFRREDGEHADAADVSPVRYKEYISLAQKFDSLELMLEDSLGISNQFIDS